MGGGIAARTGKGAGAGDAVQVADAWARARSLTRCQRRGVGESGRERPGSNEVPTGGPGQHSAGAVVQTVF
jgi:hypothetical protein